MTRFQLFLAFIMALVVGVLVALVARAGEVTDPVSACDPIDGDPACICDTYDPGLCFTLDISETPPTLAWPATAPLHVTEFQFTDASPWGFSTGTYRDDRPSCQNPTAVPATGCAINGFYHWANVADLSPEIAQFWLTGPAYDESGAPIFGTFDDRLLITLGMKSTSCIDFICRYGPSEIDVTAEGVQFSNGVELQSAFYNFNTSGYLWDTTVSLSLNPGYQGTFGWLKPQPGDAVFSYSTVFGNPVGARVKAEPVWSEIKLFNSTAYYSPWLALDLEGNPVKHNLPEPSATLMLVPGLLALAFVARGRR